MEKLEITTSEFNGADLRCKGWCHDKTDLRCKGWCHDYTPGAVYNSASLPKTEYFE